MPLLQLLACVDQISALHVPLFLNSYVAAYLNLFPFVTNFRSYWIRGNDMVILLAPVPFNSEQVYACVEIFESFLLPSGAFVRLEHLCCQIEFLLPHRAFLPAPPPRGRRQSISATRRCCAGHSISAVRSSTFIC